LSRTSEGGKCADGYRIHGGSFLSGSSSAPALVGSKLATEGNIIVVVLQYRLGVLGYLPPASSPSASDPNLGLGDVVLALKMIRNHIRNFGGDGGRVVLGSQSSGAHMIRGMPFLVLRLLALTCVALLAAPAARGLFRGAILQSDPMVGLHPSEYVHAI
jgi:carboxylesterase type B